MELSAGDVVRLERSVSIAATRRRIVIALAVLAPLVGCHLEGRTRRAERLLGELAPGVRLGQRLTDARRAMPNLEVRHPGDTMDQYTASDSGPPRAVAVVVWPGPALGEHASPDAIVEGVELVMSPNVAAKLKQHITNVLGTPAESTCAGPSIAQTDLVVVWQMGRRGGALLTFPERRPDGVVPTSRLFIYTSGWAPARSISGFGQASCSVAS
jgi:hypothetical protein